MHPTGLGNRSCDRVHVQPRDAASRLRRSSSSSSAARVRRRARRHRKGPSPLLGPRRGRAESGERTTALYRDRTLALARLQASYARRAVGFMELELTAGADLDVNGTRYVFRQVSGEAIVLEPWPVRPFVSLG